MNLARWAAAFAFTQIAEVPIYRHGFGASFARAFGASAVTHPIVWLVVVESGWTASWTIRAIAGESFAVIVEAIWFGVTWGARRGVLWSLIANATSFGLGLVAYRLFGV